MKLRTSCAGPCPQGSAPRDDHRAAWPRIGMTIWSGLRARLKRPERCHPARVERVPAEDPIEKGHEDLAQVQNGLHGGPGRLGHSFRRRLGSGQRG
jgi:hypothetical protein